MAKKKKATKKSAKKAPAQKKMTKRPAAKKAPKKVAAKKTVKASVPKENPSRVSTGSGPSAGDVARDIVAMFNAGQMKAIEEKYWSPKVVSVEGEGTAMAWHGRDAVEGKNQWWMSTHRIHGASAEGPFVGASGFAIKFAMDVEDTTNNSRTLMEEVGVYQIENGKIVREEFMYGKMTPVT
ncbi:MAG: SnoaL-like domain-containing protein [Phycisphaerales bacterium]